MLDLAELFEIPDDRGVPRARDTQGERRTVGTLGALVRDEPAGGLGQRRRARGSSCNIVGLDDEVDGVDHVPGRRVDARSADGSGVLYACGFCAAGVTLVGDLGLPCRPVALRGRIVRVGATTAAGEQQADDQGGS